jgi:phosphoribosylformylglycinamidine synthase
VVPVERTNARIAVVQFPGTNCERETVRVLRAVLQATVDLVWHQDILTPDDYACVVLPGGFAHGDHLRAGAIARFSPVMRGVEACARAGRMVIGICNGFQVLLEAGLLPGAMVRNASLEFRSEWVHCRVERADTPFTNRCTERQTLTIPVKHGEGCWYADDSLYAELEERRQIVLRYGVPVNGSRADVAGVLNERGNVMGLMPHPEHAVDPLLGSGDGALILASLIDAVRLSDLAVV